MTYDGMVWFEEVLFFRRFCTVQELLLFEKLLKEKRTPEALSFLKLSVLRIKASFQKANSS